jgi:hypothetical protein
VQRVLGIHNHPAGAFCDWLLYADVSGKKEYRQALTRWLIDRKAGRYSNSFLGKRINVSRRNIRRYVAAMPDIQRTAQYDTIGVLTSPDSVPSGQNLDKVGAVGRRLMVLRHCIVIDTRTGAYIMAGDVKRRYPYTREAVQKLLNVPHYRVIVRQRAANHYKRVPVAQKANTGTQRQAGVIDTPAEDTRQNGAQDGVKLLPAMTDNVA